MTKKVSYILSGGGIKALSYLGFIKALEEKDVHYGSLGGFSGGALASLILAMNKDYEDVKKLVADLTLWKLFEKRFLTRRTLINEELITSKLAQFVGETKFEDLKMPIAIYVTNVTDEKTEVFTKGKIFEPLRASIALAPIIPTAIINNKEYVDGGFLTVFPTKLHRTFTDLPVIGLMTQLSFMSSFKPIAKRMPHYFQMILNKYSELLLEADRPDLYFDTVLEDKGHLFSFSDMDFFYEEGYKNGKLNASKIIDYLEKHDK